MNKKIFTIPVFARRLGFQNANDPKFKQVKKLAVKKCYIKIQQDGFYADSLHHPKVIVQLQPFDPAIFLQNTVFPSYIREKNVDGYSFTITRTGRKRLLKSGEFSSHEWWVCEDCGRKIKIGQPYAGKVDFPRPKGENFPIYCKCISCFLDLVEKVYGLDAY